MRSESIIRLFKKAIQKAKKEGIDFIAISDYWDGVLEIVTIEKCRDIIVVYLKNGEATVLEDWQLEELRTNCKKWIEYK